MSHPRLVSISHGSSSHIRWYPMRIHRHEVFPGGPSRRREDNPLRRRIDLLPPRPEAHPGPVAHPHAPPLAEPGPHARPEGRPLRPLLGGEHLGHRRSAPPALLLHLGLERGEFLLLGRDLGLIQRRLAEEGLEFRPLGDHLRPDLGRLGEPVGLELLELRRLFGAERRRRDHRAPVALAGPVAHAHPAPAAGPPGEGRRRR
ncbi:MAG: hypothetical protein MZV70_30205 [Desulfobacterales bacterium]|nr:hypothetical protein [Desulfobacterales bacterium]